MQKVCVEIRRPFTWFFDESEKMYVRKDKAEKVNGLIFGRDLPSPMTIQFDRRRKIAEGRISPDSRTNADPVTCRLWEHWNAYLDDQLEF